ncbi:hypothetical protein [Rhodococcus baikonurensis]|uniref:Uncharacterized protein n=1 Tax=Rhodococcus baikonurensis TaxID=172041 RepID=A0ABV5XRY6_9NOCA
MVEQTSSSPDRVTYRAENREFESVPLAEGMWALWEEVEGNWFTRADGWIAPLDQIPALIEQELIETAAQAESTKLERFGR